MDGDGLADVIISAGSADPSWRQDAGEVYVLFGSSFDFSALEDGVLDLANLDPSQGVRIKGATAGDFLFSVAAAGDVDGDGLDDILVGASQADPYGRYNAGEAYLVFGAQLVLEAEEDGVIDLADFWEA